MAPTTSTSSRESVAPSADPAVLTATTVLPILGQHEAPGMSPEGAPLIGNLQAGKKLERRFLITPGKCYTAVAVGVGAIGVNVSFVHTKPMMEEVPSVARGTSYGPRAVLGGTSNGGCYYWHWPIAMPAKLVVEAISGQGLAAAQLYIK